MDRKLFIKLFAVIMTAVICLHGGIVCRADDTPAITYEDIAGYSSLRNLAFPSEMRAVTLTPSVDFLGGKPDGSGYTEQELTDEINSVLDRAAALSMNTVILATSYGDELFCDEEINTPVVRSIVDYASEITLSRGFYLYLDFDIGAAMSRMDKDFSLNEKIDRLAVILRNITLKYSADGIILNGYYGENSPDAFREYMENGSGIGYTQWIYEKNAYIFATAADAVKRTSNNAAVGLAAEYVWADYPEMTDGSDTHSEFSALFDGYSDTLGYVRNGEVDFILLKTEEGISSDGIPFENICSWWNDAACNAGVRLIVLHDNSRVCTGEAGWDYPDELVKQVVYARSLESCKGSAFMSLASLEENREQSTEVLMKAYSGDLNEEGLGLGLEMTLPEQTEFRTEETSVIFAGSFDPNFPVYFQGEPVELNEAGRFYFNIELKVGENVFVFENKGRKITYRITRTVRVLRDAAPRGDDIKADGGTEIALAAVAYKGSSVSAVIGNEMVELAPADGLTDDIDPNSAYTIYRGSYVLPEGTQQITELGNVQIYASYNIGGQKILECITGSRISINSVPAINTDNVSAIPNVPVTGENGEDGSTDSGNGRRVEILNDNTMTWSSRNTLTEPVPDHARLPAGTSDILSSTATYGGTAYYLTQSGRRIRKSDARLTDGDMSTDNSVELKNAYVSDGNTILVIEATDKLPFEISYGGLNYHNGNNGSFYIDNFTADEIYLDFDYAERAIDSGAVIPSDSECVFNGYEWREYNGKMRLALKLSSRGAYDGVKSHYDGNTLILSFNGTESSLAGMTVVIDPGHGYVGNGKFDPGAVQHIREQEANLAIAKKLEEKLSAAGVNVIRLKTETADYVTAQRADYARIYDPDLFIAIHCNSGSSTATGGEAYYFTPFSQPLASAVSARLGEVHSVIHGDGGNYDRGEKYNYFYVTQQQEFPSILTECGFVSNYEEAMALSNEKYQDMFAEAIMAGLRDFAEARRATSSLSRTVFN